MGIELQIREVEPPGRFGTGEGSDNVKGFTPPDFNQLIINRTRNFERPGSIETPDQAFDIFARFLQERRLKNEQSYQGSSNKEGVIYQFMRSRLSLAGAYCESLAGHCPDEQAYKDASTRVFCLATLLAMVDGEMLSNRNPETEVRAIDLLVRYGLENPALFDTIVQAAEGSIPSSNAYQVKLGYIVFGIKTEIFSARVFEKLETEHLYRMVKTPPHTDLTGGVDFIIYGGQGVSEKIFCAVDVKTAFGSGVSGIATLHAEKDRPPLLVQNGITQPYLFEAFDIPNSTIEYARKNGVPVVVLRVPAELVNIPTAELANGVGLEYNDFLQKLQLEVSHIQKKGRSVE